MQHINAVENNTYYLRQIRVPEVLYKEIKKYCINLDITQKQFYSDMLQWFFNNKSNYYHASFKKGKIVSLWVSEQWINLIKAEAIKANVADARIVFTALVEYAKENNLFDYDIFTK